MPSLDDTQPNKPVQMPPQQDQQIPREPEFEEPDSGPGCLFWSLVGLFAFFLAVMLVIMAGAAGWTEGQNIGDRNAAAAERDLIGEQLTRIPAELASNNAELVGIRLNYLETVAPDSPALPGIRATVTAIVAADATATLSSVGNPVLTAIAQDLANGDLNSAQNRLAYLDAVVGSDPLLPEIKATATQAAILLSPAEETAEAQPDAEQTEMVVEAEATSEPLATAASGGYNPSSLLSEAEIAFAQGDYEDAYDLLDAIQRIDDTFEPAEVDGLLRQTLTAWAQELFRTPDEENLAEAIRVTNLLEDTGAPLSDLNYERLIANLYLDALRAVELGNHTLAIQRINELRTYQTQYKGQDLNRLLFNEYVAYGDAWRDGGQPCQAVTQYERALQLFNESRIQGQRDTAQRLCEQGATATPGGPTPEGSVPTVAPIGVPGT